MSSSIFSVTCSMVRGAKAGCFTTLPRSPLSPPSPPLPPLPPLKLRPVGLSAKGLRQPSCFAMCARVPIAIPWLLNDFHFFSQSPDLYLLDWRDQLSQSLNKQSSTDWRAIPTASQSS